MAGRPAGSAPTGGPAGVKMRNPNPAGRANADRTRSRPPDRPDGRSPGPPPGDPEGPWLLRLAIALEHRDLRRIVTDERGPPGASGDPAGSRIRVLSTLLACGGVQSE
jgi:hypothetical protein